LKRAWNGSPFGIKTRAAAKKLEGNGKLKRGLRSVKNSYRSMSAQFAETLTFLTIARSDRSICWRSPMIESADRVLRRSRGKRARRSLVRRETSSDCDRPGCDYARHGWLEHFVDLRVDSTLCDIPVIVVSILDETVNPMTRKMVGMF
jgi:hypothetical protein